MALCQATVSRGGCVGTGLNRAILRNVNPGEEHGSKTKLFPSAITLLR